MIRTTIAAAVLALSTTPASAFGHEACSELSELAESVAEARYDGVAMRDMAARLKVDNKAYNSIITTVLKEAYSLPDYSTEEHQQRAIRELGNRVYYTCVEA